MRAIISTRIYYSDHVDFEMEEVEQALPSLLVKTNRATGRKFYYSPSIYPHWGFLSQIKQPYLVSIHALDLSEINQTELEYKFSFEYKGEEDEN